MKNKFIHFLLLLSFIFSTSCEFGNRNQHIEKQIRNEVLKETAGIASLEAIYMLTFIHFEENLIKSDDFYIQNDAVSMDYGFDLDDKSIKVVDSPSGKTLQVRLGNGEVLATNRISINKPETAHEGYRPRDAQTGVYIDVDEKMNKELEELKKIYGERNLRHARENIKNFFKIIAAKYDLTLDFQ